MKVAVLAHDAVGPSVRKLLPRDINPKIRAQLDAALGMEAGGWWVGAGQVALHGWGGMQGGREKREERGGKGKRWRRRVGWMLGQLLSRSPGLASSRKRVRKSAGYNPGLLRLPMDTQSCWQILARQRSAL